MKKRKGGEKGRLLTLADIEPGIYLLDLIHDISVGEDGSLGGAGGTAGVLHETGRIRVQLFFHVVGRHRLNEIHKAAHLDAGNGVYPPGGNFF